MIGGLVFDHVVTVWRSTESAGDLREVIRSWAKVAGAIGVGMGIQVKRETIQDAGPGERVVGEYRGYGPASLNVVEGDVIEVTAGPEAAPEGLDARLLKVDSAHRPLGRHMQLVLIQWDGVLS